MSDVIAQISDLDERAFVLRYVQPGLVGLIDGTLSTLAPIYAAALLSGSHAALFVGLATALGAGVALPHPLGAAGRTAARVALTHPLGAARPGGSRGAYAPLRLRRDPYERS